METSKPELTFAKTPLMTPKRLQKSTTIRGVYFKIALGTCKSQKTTHEHEYSNSVLSSYKANAKLQRCDESQQPRTAQKNVKTKGPALVIVCNIVDKIKLFAFSFGCDGRGF